MSLNISKGNMYEFVTHTWNPIKGECLHSCSYCYMKRWGKQNPVHLDEKELKTNIGKGNYIFIGSSTDMFSDDIPDEWISKVLNKCNEENKYLFQSKNPEKMFQYFYPLKSKFCMTLETNRHYKDIMVNSPSPIDRVASVFTGQHVKLHYLTIEPVLDFDLFEFVEMVKKCEPDQVNIGADTGRHNLPEPPKEKVMDLVYELNKFTVVHNKRNIDRLLRGTEAEP